MLIERISQGRHRVNVEELKPKHDREPAITGGYILKIDRPGPGDMGFTAGGQRLQFVYPKEREITDPQRAWLAKHFGAFAGVLSNPTVRFEPWIDVDNWIDYHFFNEYTRNPDAFTLSTYLYKRRGGKIRMGPVWDHDRSMRTNDEEYWVGRPSRPTGWTTDSLDGWWASLHADEVFQRTYRIRGRAMLAGPLELGRVHALVDAMAAEVEEAEERDRQRWPIIAPGQWYDEIVELKDWIRARDSWLKSELIAVPRLETTGPVEGRLTVAIVHDNEGGALYYTLDGADPTLIDGRASPRARLYEGPIEITGPTRVRARVLLDKVWSKQADAAYFVDTPTLAISEIMYNPSSGGDYEFLELINYGDAPIDLRGIKVDGGLQFHFSVGEVTELAPGERVVVVRDRHEFEDRYDVTAMRLAGEYHGRFSNTEATVTVTGAFGQPIASAHYVDSWLPDTDGGGYSLVAREPRRDVIEQDHWTQSAEKGGSPGW